MIAQCQLPEFVSTNDILTALLWKSIQRAEHFDHSVFADTNIPSIAMVALDSRRRAHVPIHPHTLGNIVDYSSSALPLSELLSDEMTSLADLACLIRLGISNCTNTYYDEIAHYVEHMDDVRRLVGAAFLDMPSKNVLQSNWSEFDYYGIEWGPAFGHHMKALRFPAGGVCAGFQVILPSPPNSPPGTMEVLVDLSDEAWPRLLRDETWSAFAQNPTALTYK